MGEKEGYSALFVFSIAIAVPEKTALLETPQSARPWLATAPTNPLLGFETNFAGKQKK